MENLPQTVPFTDISVWFLLEVAVTAFLIIYLIFAIVLVRQVKIMTDTLEVGFEKQIKIISYLHLAFAFGSLVFALSVL